MRQAEIDRLLPREGGAGGGGGCFAPIVFTPGLDPRCGFLPRGLGCTWRVFLSSLSLTMNAFPMKEEPKQQCHALSHL
jgi:hypothetical protein